MVEKLIDGVLHTKESIFESWRAYINKEAHKVGARALALGFEHEDVVSEGSIGLLKAFDRFDDSHEVVFAALATRYVTGSIYKALRGSELGVNYSRGIKELAYSIRRGELEDKNPQVIAEKLNAQERNVVYALEFLTHRFPQRLESPILSPEDDLTLGDTLPDRVDGSNIFVNDFFCTLSKWEIDVLELTSAGYSQMETARLLNCTQQQVSRGLKKMKGKYDAYTNGVAYIEPRRGPKRKG